MKPVISLTNRNFIAMISLAISILNLEISTYLKGIHWHKADIHMTCCDQLGKSILKRTVLVTVCFDNPSGSHLQSQVNSVCRSKMNKSGLFNMTSQFNILTEHNWATRNSDANNHIAVHVHHELTKHIIDWEVLWSVLNLQYKLFSTTDSGKLVH